MDTITVAAAAIGVINTCRNTRVMTLADIAAGDLTIDQYRMDREFAIDQDRIYPIALVLMTTARN